MSEYDDTIQIKAWEVKEGDVVASGRVVTDVKHVSYLSKQNGQTVMSGHVTITLDDDSSHRVRSQDFVAVREVVTD
jgi:hypothetical protein